MSVSHYISAPSKIFSMKFLAIYVASIALLIVSSKLQVPMVPVPITFQTVAILLIPALFGLTLSLSTLTSWLALGAMGLPVFAGNAPLLGLSYFMGPTGGYFLGFMAATVMTAIAVHQFKLTKIMPLTVLFIVMHAVILFFGWVWLAYGVPQIGSEKAWLSGVSPFLIGSLLKSALLTTLVYPSLNKK